MSQTNLPDELIIDGQHHTDSYKIAFRLNNYFASVSDLFKSQDEPLCTPDFNKLGIFIKTKVPNYVFFNIPYILMDSVSEFINGLNPAKATGLNGIGPRILKFANSSCHHQ